MARRQPSSGRTTSTPPGITAQSIPTPSLSPARAAHDPLRESLNKTCLGEKEGLAVWVHSRVLGRLHQELRAEWEMLAPFVDRYKIPLDDLIRQLAEVALRWNVTRPLAHDAAFTEQAVGTKLDTPSRRCLLTALRIVADFLRDEHAVLAADWDRCVVNLQATDASGMMPAGARGSLAMLTLLGSATDRERDGRPSAVTVADLSVGVSANLFAPDVVEALDGRALLQAAMLGVRWAETRVPITPRRAGRPHALLAIEREGAKALKRFLLPFLPQRAKRPEILGYVALLLTLACPSRTLMKWRKAAWHEAIGELPPGQQPTWPAPLPANAKLRGVYLRELGDRLRHRLRDAL